MSNLSLTQRLTKLAVDPHGENGRILGQAPDLARDAIEELDVTYRYANDLRAALVKIAAYDDTQASEYLNDTKSYRLFDEPNSVKIAREALK